jgi:hypothetical protein
VYLSDPVSRVVDRPGDHFKAGVRTWYNRYRQHEARRGGVAKKAATRNESVKVKYLVAVAVYVTILESNIVLINNRLAHLGHLSASSRVPAARGDGCIMPPSFPLFIVSSICYCPLS